MLCVISGKKKLILKTLQFSLTKDVRSQNMQLPILRVAGNPYARKMMWGWLTKNWKPLLDKIGIGNPLANRIVGSIRLFADDTMEPKIRKFFKRNPVLGTERTLEQSLEKVRIQSKFLKSMKREFPMGDN